MILSFHPCLEADIHLVLADRVPGPAEQSLIQRAEAVILPQALPYSLFELCEQSGARVFPDYRARFRYPGKTGQHELFTRHGFATPPTRCWPSVEALFRAWGDGGSPPHPFPFLIKQDHAHEGEGITIIHNERSLKQELQRLASRMEKNCRGFLTQELIPTGGNALRVAVMGRRFVSFWKRATSAGEVVVTISRGARIDIDWRPDLQERGIEEVKRLALKTGINLAAVDLVFPEMEVERHPLFLEINYYFGRRGLGGSAAYYELLYGAVRDWLAEQGLDPARVRLI